MTGNRIICMTSTPNCRAASWRTSSIRAWSGDHALLWAEERVLFTGDILNGQVERSLVDESHYRWHPGLYFGARPGYVDRHEDPKGLKASIAPLLDWNFDTVCGSHGVPYREDVKVTLTELLETIDAD